MAMLNLKRCDSFDKEICIHKILLRGTMIIIVVAKKVFVFRTFSLLLKGYHIVYGRGAPGR